MLDELSGAGGCRSSPRNVSPVNFDADTNRWLSLIEKSGNLVVCVHDVAARSVSMRASSSAAARLWTAMSRTRQHV
jgi:hypothetical protein